MTEPARINTAEVCALARYTTATLWRRIDAGIMPKPIDRGSGGYLFDRKAVLVALGQFDHETQPAQTEWDFDPAAYRDAQARRLRRGKGAGWRDKPRVLSGSGPPLPGGMVTRHTPATHGTA